MFIRVKYIKNQPYAYKVKNRWTKKGTRQKTNGYFGRVYFLKPQGHHNLPEFNNSINFLEDIYLKKNSSRVMILDLVRYELLKHGFKYKGKNKNILLFTPNNPKSETSHDSNEKNLKSIKQTNQIRVDLAPSILSISDNKKPIVLGLNNDFLCNYTLRKLARFKSFSTEEECGKELAKVFIQAGISPEPNIFIAVFEKVYSKLGSYVI